MILAPMGNESATSCMLATTSRCWQGRYTAHIFYLWMWCWYSISVDHYEPDFNDMECIGLGWKVLTGVISLPQTGHHWIDSFNHIEVNLADGSLLCSCWIIHCDITSPLVVACICHDLIILMSDWCLPITHHFRKITLWNHLQTTHLPSHPKTSIHNTTQNITSSLSGDQMLLSLNSLIGFPNCSMARLRLCAITIPIFPKGIFYWWDLLHTMEFSC